MPTSGVYEKWDKQAKQIITVSSAQPASSSHLQPQEYQGRRLPTSREISHNSIFPINLNIFNS